MAQLLSHRSKVEICTFLEYDECIRLPSTEWRLIAKHCVLQGNEDDPADIPSDEYFSSDGFRIAVGERSLSEALKLVFSPGEDLLLWQAVPNGFIEAVVERYLTSRKSPRLLAMRHVVITGLNVTDVWINAYYSSFPCYECSTSECGESENVAQCLVFHLTPHGRSGNSLSLKYTYRITSEVESVKEQQVEVLVDATKCGGLGEKRKKSVRNTKRYAQLSVESFLRRRLTKPKSLLGLAELRTEVFQFLPRSALDTCLLVGHQWKAEIEDLYLDLALRELKYIRITHNYEEDTVSFFVSTGKSGHGPIRCFTFPRDAHIDCAIVVNHLRNCVGDSSINCFNIAVDGHALGYSFTPWTVALLGSLKNFTCEGVGLYLDSVDAFNVLDFLESTHKAFEACNTEWGLWDLWLQIEYSALDTLVDERFVEWAFIQHLHLLRLELFLFGPPDDPVWIRSLFELPHVMLDVAYYVKSDVDGVDWTAHAFDIMGEIMREFEDASDVSNFVRSFEFQLLLPALTWDHAEPTPTHSNVPDERLSGRYNVYLTKNKTTGVPLSVLVNTKESVEVNVFGDEERSFVYRKELYELPSDDEP